jgi:hemin uptake protein HemP
MGKSRMIFAPRRALDPAAAAAAGRKPRVESQRLFQGHSEIVIVHHDEEYSLRITKNGKLILTK